MGRSRYKFVEGRHPHFVSCTTVNWIPLFGSMKITDILFDSLSYLQEHERLEIYAYIVMENHLHLVASSERLGKEIGIFKSFTARKIIDFLIERKAKNVLGQLNYHKLKHRQDRDYQLWQEGSHPKMLQDEKAMIQKIEYIHYNPVRRGYVDEPVHWRYSSARNYAGMEGMIEITRF